MQSAELWSSIVKNWQLFTKESMLFCSWLLNPLLINSYHERRATQCYQRNIVSIVLFMSRNFLEYVLPSLLASLFRVAKAFRVPWSKRARIRHRSELTKRDWENAVQDLCITHISSLGKWRRKTLLRPWTYLLLRLAHMFHDLHHNAFKNTGNKGTLPKVKMDFARRSFYFLWASIFNWLLLSLRNIWNVNAWVLLRKAVDDYNL